MKDIMDLAAEQYGLLLIAQLYAHGLTRDQVRSLVRRGILQRISRGVYRVAGAPPTWRQRLLADVYAAGPGAVASHQSTAALCRVPGFAEGPIVVTRRGHPSGLRVNGRFHETSNLPAAHATVVEGIPTTTLERMVFDLCQIFGDQHAGRTMDHLLNQERTTLAALETVLATLAKRGRDGTRRMRRLLDARGAGFVPSESELEDLAIAVLEAAGVPAPSRQVSVGGTTSIIGRVDLVYRRARLVIEVDSRAWHGGWTASVEDRRRDLKLTAAGWRVIRVTFWQLTHEPELFVAAVLAVLQGAA